MKIVRSGAIFLYTLAIYVGLPLLGWGFDDLNGFITIPPVIGYTASITAFGLLAAYLIHLPGGIGNRGKGEADKFVPRQRMVRLLVTGMLFGALVCVPFTDRRNIGVMADLPPLRWAGLVLADLGMGLIFWSGWALGRLYSPEVTLQKDHHLITGGPYRSIRHPRYLGGMIQGIGLSGLFRSWIGLVLTLIFTAIILFRIQDEESLMRQEFGPEWETYCKKTWRLLPFVF